MDSREHPLTNGNTMKKPLKKTRKKSIGTVAYEGPPIRRPYRRSGRPEKANDLIREILEFTAYFRAVTLAWHAANRPLSKDDKDALMVTFYDQALYYQELAQAIDGR